ncbi:conserved hypothetical protein [Ricinus communis]|uniref:Uncharacterized protein n=1 Tax=Ricinus communis TaxID=3988 RepID=B9SRN7_RICCO|nr:conserved hypothetical protein [Ricinus communis]
MHSSIPTPSQDQTPQETRETCSNSVERSRGGNFARAPSNTTYSLVCHMDKVTGVKESYMKVFHQ